MSKLRHFAEALLAIANAMDSLPDDDKAAALYYIEKTYGPPRQKPKRPRVGIDPELRWMILNDPEAACASCSTTEDLQIDHILPWSRGGTNDPANLQILCGPCNRSKGARVPAGA